MRTKAIYDLSPESLSPARIRLLKEHDQFGWKVAAARRRVNVKYLYNYVLKGIIPHNPKIRARLGIRRSVTINQLLRLPIQDQPPEVLRWAIEHREELSNV